MGEIQMQTAQIFPPKDLVYFLTRWQTPFKEQPFFPPKKLSFFPILYQTPFKSAFIFPAKRLSLFFDSMTDSIQRAAFFPPKNLVFFRYCIRLLSKARLFFSPRDLVFFFRCHIWILSKPPLFSRQTTFLPKIYFESVQTFTVLYNTFAFSDYESSIVCGTSSLMINYLSFILQSKKNRH